MANLLCGRAKYFLRPDKSARLRRKNLSRQVISYTLRCSHPIIALENLDRMVLFVLMQSFRPLLAAGGIIDSMPDSFGSAQLNYKQCNMQLTVLMVTGLLQCQSFLSFGFDKNALSKGDEKHGSLPSQHGATVSNCPTQVAYRTAT
jgi:hypothetical protein